MFDVDVGGITARVADGVWTTLGDETPKALETLRALELIELPPGPWADPDDVLAGLAAETLGGTVLTPRDEPAAITVPGRVY